MLTSSMNSSNESMVLYSFFFSITFFFNVFSNLFADKAANIPLETLGEEWSWLMYDNTLSATPIKLFWI